MLTYDRVVACYDRFELAAEGPDRGNPFTEVQFEARFTNGERTIQAPGFYDGAGIYRVRLMPDEPGAWQFRTHSSLPELDGLSGDFTCAGPRPGVHGPVRVAGQYHFAFADGAPFRPIGTTCYAWIHQDEALEQRTLDTLRQSPFNKIRMCVFPKHYRYNDNEPRQYPFERSASGSATGEPSGEASGGWDFTRFSPAFFQHLEQRVADLGALGIEADLILFHPYDRWGFADMGRAADERYLRYIAARLSAYRNVWWSLANEYDLLRQKTTGDWDRYFQLLQTQDPHNHLRSVHNWQGLDTHDTRTFYDHRKPWVTHCSIQHPYVDRVTEWREQYGKPVVVDECCYEGNLPNGWGNITAQEMVRRFWESAVRGGYATHGETFLDPRDVIWWSKGGVLHGESARRIAFLQQVLASLDGNLDPLGRMTDTNLSSAGRPGKYYLTYFGFRQPAQMTITLETEGQYRAELIDTWEMTVTPLPGTFEKTCAIALPAKPYLAVLVRRSEP